nr:hypothetical protein [Tanacetum cinerariifolium]
GGGVQVEGQLAAVEAGGGLLVLVGGIAGHHLHGLPGGVEKPGLVLAHGVAAAQAGRQAPVGAPKGRKRPLGARRTGAGRVAKAGGRVGSGIKIIPAHHAGIVAQAARYFELAEGPLGHAEAAEVKQAVGRNGEVGGGE